MEDEYGKRPPNEAEENKPKKKPLTPGWIAAYAGIAILFAAGIFILGRQYILPPDPDFAVPTPRPMETPAATATPAETTPPEATPSHPGVPVETAEPTPVPTREPEIPAVIYFDKQEQKASIIPVGIEEGNIMGSPDDASLAGWFYYAGSPGDPGNTVINGHQAFGGKKGVFSVLKTMEPGEGVTVEFESGLLRYFEVERVETYLEEDVPQEYLHGGGETRLTLITCKGDYGLDGRSRSRVVAICKEKLDMRQADDPFVEADTAKLEPAGMHTLFETIPPPSLTARHLPFTREGSRRVADFCSF